MVTEAELRHAVLNAFHDLHEHDWQIIASAAKGYLETFALSVPAVAALDALLAYFRQQTTHS